MGVLDRFERGIERAVNGAFAKAFKAEVQPVELASALRRETDTEAAVVARDRTLVPNAFVIELGPSDHDRVMEWDDTLAEELADAVTDHARQQRYAFVGPVSIRLERDEELETGVFRVRSARVKGTVAPATAATATPHHPVLDVDGRRYQLTGAVTVLGRGSDADVVVDDPGVSRRHAEIRLDGDSAVIRDLGSTNGTFVDGERTSTARLVDGSRITVGRTRITISFHGDRGDDDA
ncbi:MAG: FhaA domain-containing protein [Actinomycetes bacterium]